MHLIDFHHFPHSIAKELDESVVRVSDIDFVYPDHGLVLLEENPVYQFQEADACTRFFVPDFSNSNQLCTDNGEVTYNSNADVYQHHSKRECCEVSYCSFVANLNYSTTKVKLN